jgi:hypothetical protein
MQRAVAVAILVLVAVSAGRTIFSGESADKRFAWVGSAKYPLTRTGSNNNAVVLMMGYRFPWQVTPRAPYWALAFADGVKAVPKQSGGGYQWRVFEDGFVAGVIMSFNGIAEYCELNGIPGIQWRRGDRIISFHSWRDTTWNNLVTGVTDGVYWGNVSDSTGAFALNCRASSAAKVEGITVGPYGVKCDVVLNSTALWSSGNVNCSDDRRFIALRVFFGGVKIDVNGDEVDLDNTPDAEDQRTLNFTSAYFKWKKTIRASALNNEQPVVAQIFGPSTEVTDLPKVTKEIREAAFTFNVSKATNPGLLVWDPVIGINSSAALIPFLLLSLLAILASLL